MSERSPLHELHRELGARFVEFGGWEMPVQYESVIAEHRAVRDKCGWFDVSHLGRFRWEGRGATATLRSLLCNDAARFEPTRTHYTMLLNPSGGVVDDHVVWRWADESYWVLPNAVNHDRVMAAFAAAAPAVELEDLRTSTAMLAVQGPRAPAVLEAVLGEAPKRFRTLALDDVRGAGTGYTGERGGEVVVGGDDAIELARRLTAAGARPCGLGARDTLRLEAGLPLWGQDLDEATTPLEAGLDFAVAWDHDFAGKVALETQRRTGLGKRLVGFRMEGRHIPRHGYPLRSARSTGAVTSGNYSPLLESGIGLGYLSPPDTGPVEVQVRGEWLPGQTVELPFVQR